MTKATKPTRMESKQAITDSIAREAIAAENAARRAKTERLRALRLARDQAVVKPRPRRAAKRRGQ